MIGNRMKPCSLLVAALAFWVVPGNLPAAEFGDFQGAVVLDGDVPPVTLLIKKGAPDAKDAAVCAANDIPDESLVVDPTTKGVANVVVYLAKAPSEVHPDLKATSATVDFDQVGCRFLPHVLLVQTSQKVRVLSGDAVAHNTRGNPFKNAPFNFTVAANLREGPNVPQVPLKSAERLPVKVVCDIHPWMDAYWVVVDHPYAAVTGAQGQFMIPKLPVGEHEFRVWHERPGYIERSLKVKITAEGTTLPIIKVKAKDLAKKS